MNTPSVEEARAEERLPYFAALDGVRAAAVAAVVAFHFFTRGATGGYLGVDMFFVLSGYLITSLLLIEWHNRSSIDLRAFWARRARRLLPALFLVLTVVALWASFAYGTGGRRSLRGEELAALFYGANWYRIVEGASTTREGLSPLLHLWSLAIEEQFYLVWPLVVVLCLRVGRGGLRLLATVAIAVSVVSIVLMPLLFVPNDEARAYMGTDARAHQLLVGALLAMALRVGTFRRLSERWAPRVLGPLGAVVVVIAVFFAPGPETSRFLYDGGSVLFAVAVAFVIAAVVAPGKSRLRSALSLAPVVWLGQISYGIYLWHVPVRAIVSNEQMGLGGPALLVTRVAVTLAAAALSYYLVERPIRRGLVGGRLALVATPAAVLGVVTAILISTA